MGDGGGASHGLVLLKYTEEVYILFLGSRHPSYEPNTSASLRRSTRMIRERFPYFICYCMCGFFSIFCSLHFSQNLAVSCIQPAGILDDATQS